MIYHLQLHTVEFSVANINKLCWITGLYRYKLSFCFIMLWFHPTKLYVVSFLEEWIQLLEASRNYILTSKSSNPTKQQTASSSAVTPFHGTIHILRAWKKNMNKQGQNHGLEADHNLDQVKKNRSWQKAPVFSFQQFSAIRWRMRLQENKPLSIA